MTSITEADESAAMEWLSNLGWETAYGPDITPGTPAAERDNYAQVVLEPRLRDALERLNPDLDDEAYTGTIVREPAMENPTIVVLTDRNDLDGQLFGTFSRCQDLLRQTPTQADSRADLRQKLSVNTGGVVFTTIQKFFPDERGDTHPLLSDRRNIVVIADEAHRSQYGFIDGFASHMRSALPNAAFLGFTGGDQASGVGTRRRHQDALEKKGPSRQ